MCNMAAPLPLCEGGEVVVEVDAVLVGGARHAARARALALGSYLAVSAEYLLSNTSPIY